MAANEGTVLEGMDEEGNEHLLKALLPPSQGDSIDLQSQ